MHAFAPKRLSILALSAALGLATVSGAIAQNENASDIAHEQANENAEGAGSEANASGDVNAAANANSDNAEESTSPGPEEGHDCTGVGHTESEGLGHANDDCPTSAGAGTLSAGQSRALFLDNAPTVNAAAETCGENTLDIVVSQEDLDTIATASTADLYEVNDCPSMQADLRVREVVGANTKLVTAIEGAGFAVEDVVTGTVEGGGPVIYVEAD